MRNPKDIKKRIREIEKHYEETDANTPWGAWFSLGWRIALEWGVAVCLGYGAGYFIDRFFGIQPWGVIGFLLLGNIAGLMNIYRVLKADIKTF